MLDAKEMVFIIDDDPAVRLALGDLLSAVGLRHVALGSVAEYLASQRPDEPACILLDINLPDITGLEFQAQIDTDDHPPIVFITGIGDVPSSVNAMKRGAVDFLTKPVRKEVLLEAITSAVDLDRLRRQERGELRELLQRYARLTPREQEVLPFVVSGLQNKQAAARMGISEITFQVHRRQVMQKMNAASLADLVRMATKMGIPITHTAQAGANPQ